jgi:hypothetical protein
MTQYSLHRIAAPFAVNQRRSRTCIPGDTFTMDFTRLEINRRMALLTSAAIAANVIDPMRAFAQETPRLKRPQLSWGQPATA